MRTKAVGLPALRNRTPAASRSSVPRTVRDQKTRSQLRWCVHDAPPHNRLHESGAIVHRRAEKGCGRSAARSTAVPAIRLFENSDELFSSRGAVEPVSCLRCRDEIHTGVWQRRSFSVPGRTDQLRKSGKQSFSCTSHLRVGFDRKDPVAIFQQHSRPNTGARSDVRNYMPRSQAALHLQCPQSLTGISGAITDVVLDSIGESTGRVGSGHKREFDLPESPF
jgi:hypothetical protein